MKPEDEIRRNLLTESRARSWLALKQFCKEVSNNDPCLNYRDCDECPVHQRMEEIKSEVMGNP